MEFRILKIFTLFNLGKYKITGELGEMEKITTEKVSLYLL